MQTGRHGYAGILGRRPIPLRCLLSCLLLERSDVEPLAFDHVLERGDVRVEAAPEPDARLAAEQHLIAAGDEIAEFGGQAGDEDAVLAHLGEVAAPAVEGASMSVATGDAQPVDRRDLAGG